MSGELGEYGWAILLGVVQGVTEFLPISSSGHLVLVPALAGREASSLSFDVGLHVGTTVAVGVALWNDWVRLIRGGIRDAIAHRGAYARWSTSGRLGLQALIASVPVALIGVAANDVIEAQLRGALIVASMLIVFGLLLGAADRFGRLFRRLDALTIPHAVAIGVAQSLALVPGVSRSGATISACRALGYDRQAAVRFSFLMATPAILGAGLLELVGSSDVAIGPSIVGATIAAVVGILSIRWLLSFLTGHGFGVFVWYRLMLGITIFAVQIR